MKFLDGLTKVAVLRAGWASGLVAEIVTTRCRGLGHRADPERINSQFVTGVARVQGDALLGEPELGRDHPMLGLQGPGLVQSTRRLLTV